MRSPSTPFLSALALVSALALTLAAGGCVSVERSDEGGPPGGEPGTEPEGGGSEDGNGGEPGVEPDTVEPGEPDAGEPEPDATEPAPDATEPTSDTIEPEPTPDVTEPAPDTIEPEPTPDTQPDTTPDTTPDTVEPEPTPDACTPQCAGKDCGGDGCGGTCGGCEGECLDGLCYVPGSGEGSCSALLGCQDTCAPFPEGEFKDKCLATCLTEASELAVEEAVAWYTCLEEAGCAGADNPELCVALECSGPWAACFSDSSGETTCWEITACFEACESVPESILLDCQSACIDEGAPDAQAKFWAAVLCAQAKCKEDTEGGFTECEEEAISNDAQCAKLRAECQSDGCDLTCPPGSFCIGGECVSTCTTQCGSKVCGPDGCGGDCGTCGEGKECKEGQCAAGCTPHCSGKECGPDSCGGECGFCAGGWSCLSGLCEPPAPSCVEGAYCDGNAVVHCIGGVEYVEKCSPGETCFEDPAFGDAFCDMGVIEQCSSASECPPDHACELGFCVPADVAMFCPDVVECVDACGSQPGPAPWCADDCYSSAPDTEAWEAEKYLGCLWDNGCSGPECALEHCVPEGASCAFQGLGPWHCADALTCSEMCGGGEDNCFNDCGSKAKAKEQKKLYALWLCVGMVCPLMGDPCVEKAFFDGECSEYFDECMGWDG